RSSADTARAYTQISIRCSGPERRQETRTQTAYPRKIQEIPGNNRHVVPSGGGLMYYQSYDPMGNVFLSTLIAAVPIVVLLYFIALHPHRDAQGTQHLGLS